MRLGSHVALKRLVEGEICDSLLVGALHGAKSTIDLFADLQGGSAAIKVAADDPSQRLGEGPLTRLCSKPTRRRWHPSRHLRDKSQTRQTYIYLLARGCGLASEVIRAGQGFRQGVGRECNHDPSGYEVQGFYQQLPHRDPFRRFLPRPP